MFDRIIHAGSDELRAHHLGIEVHIVGYQQSRRADGLVEGVKNRLQGAAVFLGKLR